MAGLSPFRILPNPSLMPGLDMELATQWALGIFLGRKMPGIYLD